MRFEIYRDKQIGYRWRLMTRDHQVMADSGEGYDRRDVARRAIAALQTAILTARIVDVG